MVRKSTRTSTSATSTPKKSTAPTKSKYFTKGNGKAVGKKRQRSESSSEEEISEDEYEESVERQDEETEEEYQQESEDDDAGSTGSAVIKPKTLQFLKELAKNNDRDWFSMNKDVYNTAFKNFEIFVDAVSEQITEKDTTVPELPRKDLIFRIYRDVRFSNDKTPYKTYLSSAWSRTGRKGPYAAYYVSIQPNNNTFVGGGLWHANADALTHLRTEIDTDPQRLKTILKDPDFFANFLDAPSTSVQSKTTTTTSKKKKGTSIEERAVEMFVQRNSEDALKTAPKNYPKDHKDIDLLRLRSFTVGKRFADQEVLATDFVSKLGRLVGVMEPFINLLNDIVMHDPALDEDDDDDE